MGWFCQRCGYAQKFPAQHLSLWKKTGWYRGADDLGVPKCVAGIEMVLLRVPAFHPCVKVAFALWSPQGHHSGAEGAAHCTQTVKSFSASRVKGITAEYVHGISSAWAVIRLWWFTRNATVEVPRHAAFVGCFFLTFLSSSSQTSFILLLLLDNGNYLFPLLLSKISLFFFFLWTQNLRSF